MCAGRGVDYVIAHPSHSEQLHHLLPTHGGEEEAAQEHQAQDSPRHHALKRKDPGEDRAGQAEGTQT